MTFQPQGISNAENPSDEEEDKLNDENDIVDFDQQTDGYKEEAKYTKNELVGKLANAAWSSATQRRKVADFCGGGYRSGNRSKCMCAQAAKEALVKNGVCTSYLAGHAAQTHTQGSLRRSCPNLKLAKSASARNKLIVYSGYAGKVKHQHGHIEIKIPITAQLKKKMGKDGIAYEVGQYMFCSDFCRPTPTKKKTNTIEAIYTLN
ncbi:hypothetical protein K2X05_13965 [bacterium]|nr:hypothetical protein [bacterium]